MTKAKQLPWVVMNLLLSGGVGASCNEATPGLGDDASVSADADAEIDAGTDDRDASPTDRSDAGDASGTNEDPIVGLDMGGGTACVEFSSGRVSCWGQILGEPAGDIVDGVMLSDVRVFGVVCGLDPATRAGRCVPDLESPPAGVRLDSLDVSGGVCFLEEAGAVGCVEPAGNQFRTEDLPEGQLENVEMARSFACGLRPSGEILCFGRLTFPGIPFPGELPVGSFTEISVNYDGGCGLRGDRTIDCFGYVSDAVPPSGEYVQVFWGNGRGCALDDQGRARCFGGDIEELSQASPVSDFRFKYIAADRNACGVTLDDKVLCFGNETGVADDVPEDLAAEI